MRHDKQENIEAAERLIESTRRFHNADTALRAPWRDKLDVELAEEYIEARREHQKNIEAFEALS